MPVERGNYIGAVMWDQLLVFLFIFHNVGFAQSGYPPMGDEVQAGSVLLPASRRGRYLANIVRRQAVDGTGIKFNKDADRMNAEAKKKVDVLSEELLPYIIAEQERRTTLYKRVMTAIQNGEKGVTIAEIRNKPPAIIRKGLMYRCPSNRAPREPDGSGVVTCEDGLDPTPIMFESCLSAEDKELYVAENKYFFCNRHKIEGPDLPRNGTTVIGCAPCERTSLNYTSQRCALEDTDDVVVHYRYYPDRTYKFVSELDPEREVCEHWNPCQVGYIFSLPGPDQATPASELWHDYEDDKNETVFIPKNKTVYLSSARRIRIPNGYKYDGIGFYQPNGTRTRISLASETPLAFGLRSIYVYYKMRDDSALVLVLVFSPLQEKHLGTYYVRFESLDKKARKHVPLVTIGVGETQIKPLRMYTLPAKRINTTSINFTCAQCTLRGIMIRTFEGDVRNCEPDKYHLRKLDEKQTVIDFEFGVVTPRDFGDYFLIMQTDDGSEERVKALAFIVISLKRVDMSVKLGARVDVSVDFKYANHLYVLVDITCRGESMFAAGRAGMIKTRKTGRITLNIPSFENSDACDYIGEFRLTEYETCRESIAVLEMVKLLDGEPKQVKAPAEGKPFDRTIKYQCAGCTIANVTVNGLPLETTTRRSGVGSVAYYLPGQQSVTIGITEFQELYGGVYQAIFQFGDLYVTKNLMEIVLPDQSPPAVDIRRSGGGDNKDEGDSTVDQQQPGGNIDEQQPGAKDENAEADEEEKTSSPDQQKNLSASGMRRSLADADKSLSVEMAREAAAAGAPYKRAVRFTAPGGTLAAVSCRGRDLSGGWRVLDDTANIEFDRFEDSNACVYVGVFKFGNTEYRKTLAVIENNLVNVSMSTVAAAAATLDQTVVYTCGLAHCDPEMIYINNRTLKSDDKEHFYSYNAETVTGPAGNVTTVSVHFSIAPFTKEFEGMYQVVVRNGAETVTKNILEVGTMA